MADDRRGVLPAHPLCPLPFSEHGIIIPVTVGAEGARRSRPCRRARMLGFHSLLAHAHATRGGRFRRWRWNPSPRYCLTYRATDPSLTSRQPAGWPTITSHLANKPSGQKKKMVDDGLGLQRCELSSYPAMKSWTLSRLYRLSLCSCHSRLAAFRHLVGDICRPTY